MNEALSNRLHTKFPDLYKLPIRGTLNEDFFIEFECGDGWFGLLHDLSIKLTEKVKEYQNKYPEDVEIKFHAIQVKEKYGTLHFYTNYSTDAMHEVIREAEKKSSHTCEVCGQPGLIDSHGWIQVRCDEHNRR